MAVLGNTICAGYNDSGANRYSGLARSTDLGATWTDLGEIGQRGDPVIAVHEASGTFYYAEIATIGGNPAIGVAVSGDDCASFGAAVDAGPGASAIVTTTLNDKPWIAVDNTGGANDGNIYVCWTRFDPGLASGSELRFSRSTDGGATYVNEQILAAAGTAPFGCSVAVGSDGAVNVSWADRTGATQDDIRFRRSTDAGVTFSAAISASTGNRHPGIDTVVFCSPNNRPTLTGNIRQLHQSWLAVDDTGGTYDGNLYLVWASDPVGTPDNSDVLFSRSTDGGATWSVPVQLGIEAGPQFTDQFEPFVAVGGTGTISVAWYDRRNDPANNNLIDVYKTFSHDGGATFDPIVRVTDVNFAPPPINPNFDPNIASCYMGEYIAIAADANHFYYMWGDNRNTLITTNFPDPGRPDPDIFFEAEEILVPNTPPIADANGPYNVGEGASISLDATGSSDAQDANAALLFEWDLDNDGVYDDATGESPIFSAAGRDGPDLQTIGLRVIDTGGLSDTDTATVIIDNVPPTANDDGGVGFTTDEDTPFTTADVRDNDTDPSPTDPLTVTGFDVTGTMGLVFNNGDGTFDYDPNGQFESLGTGDSAIDSFDYTVSDDDGGSDTATVFITVTGVNDAPVMTSVSPPSQTVDYSDFIETVTITATDVDSYPLTLSDDAPIDLSTTGGCPPNGVTGSHCIWTMDGQVLVPGLDTYQINFTANDTEADSSCSDTLGVCTHALTVEPEDATVVLDDENDVSIEVPEADVPSGPFSLNFFAWEMNDVSPPIPDDPDFSHAGAGKADHGDLNNAQAFMSLVPVGPGGPITVLCTVLEVSPAAAGYDQVLEAKCDFDEVPVNVYEVIARVDGLTDTTRYYFGESAEGVFVVFDPSLGFTTGGGWFYWPETYSEDLCGSEYLGDKTNIGFSMKYNKKRKSVQGSLLLMRHELDGLTCLEDTYKVKSNALDEMAIGDVEDDPPYGWAAINGKATFREPGVDNTGGNPFLMYVEDHGEQGCNQAPADEFWIEVQTKDGVILLQLNGPEPADNNPDNDPPLDGDDEPIECGNIIVPHKPGGKGKGKNKP